MKYTEKWPNISAFADALTGSGVRMSMREGECVHCKATTPFVDMSLQSYICSEECSKEEWDEYYKALDTIPPQKETQLSQ